jgi:hypothetical protein
VTSRRNTRKQPAGRQSSGRGKCTECPDSEDIDQRGSKGAGTPRPGGNQLEDRPGIRSAGVRPRVDLLTAGHSDPDTQTVFGIERETVFATESGTLASVGAGLRRLSSHQVFGTSRCSRARSMVSRQVYSRRWAVDSERFLMDRAWISDGGAASWATM